MKLNMDNMNGMERRQFMKMLSMALASPWITRSTAFAALDLVAGSAVAEAQALGATYFLEVTLRDQFELSNLFLAPTLGREFNRTSSLLACYDAPIANHNGLFVTPYGSELVPHLDSIAVMELGEQTVEHAGGHGHEAANPLRSPGRQRDPGNGKRAMAPSGTAMGPNGGNGDYYSATPTPLVLHNAISKSQRPDLINGTVLKFDARNGFHPMYHFDANLSNAAVNQFSDQNSFRNFINPKMGGGGGVQVSQTTLSKFAAAITDLTKRLDDAHLARVLADQQLKNSNTASLNATKTSLAGTGQAAPASNITSVNLSNEELGRFRSGVQGMIDGGGGCSDNQQCDNASRADLNPADGFAYASRLFRSGRMQSMGIDMCMMDIHRFPRTPTVCRTEAAQVGQPLGRLISDLKAAGIWERTTIVIFTGDGSRSPTRGAVESEGGKNGIILAGGRIRGGYYGDINVTGTGTGDWNFRRPDANGQLVPNASTGNNNRVSGAEVYKTVLTAAGIPASTLNSYADVASAPVMSYMLK